MPFPDDDATFENVTVFGTIIVGDPTDNRIELVPDYFGFGPALLFYPTGGGDPTVHRLGFGVVYTIFSPDNASQLSVHDGGISLVLADATEPINLIADRIGYASGPSGGAPQTTLAVDGAGADDFHGFARFDRFSTSPGGNLDVTAAAFAAWSPTIAVDVPLWATRCIAQWWATAIDITGIGTWELRQTLDGQAGRTVFTTPNGMQTYGFADSFGGLTPGTTVNIEVRGRRTAGAAALRATVDSDFGFVVTWLP